MSVRPRDTMRQAGCEGKGRFASPTLAHKVLKRAGRSRGHTNRVVAVVYRCSYCGGWHIGRPSSLQ
jgi:hypothetical protein